MTRIDRSWRGFEWYAEMYNESQNRVKCTIYIYLEIKVVTKQRTDRIRSNVIENAYLSICFDIVLFLKYPQLNGMQYKVQTTPIL